MAKHRPVDVNERYWGKIDSILTKSILASICLHVLIFALLYQHVRLPAEPALVPASSPDIQIELVRTNPLRSSVQSSIQEADTSLPAPALDLSSDNHSTDSTPKSETSADATKKEIAKRSVETDGSSETISSAALNAAIHNFKTTYRRDLNHQWLENCIRRRNERVGSDCDDDDIADYMPSSEERENIGQLFTDMQPDRYYSPYKRRFEQANIALEPLAKRDDLVGELARTRHDLNAGNLSYLNRKFTGDKPNMMRICPSMPCVFRFSEFEVKKPEEWEKTPENPDRFQLTTPLFKTK